MAGVGYGSLPFKEQIAFFRRKLNLPTSSWTDIWQEMHDHAFVVAGVNRMDMLEDFRDAVDRAIAKGETLEQFRRRFDTIVARYGWDYNGGRNWRSRVIYETNLRTSYAAGRWQQLQALKRVRPFWRYRHADGEKYPRPEHEAWDGLVLSADDAWWLTHYPPGGWGCKCYVEALNQRDLDRMGLKVGTAPPLDMQTVTVGIRGPTPRTVQTPAGIDPGFGYAPGRDAWLEHQVQGALDASASSPALEAAETLLQMLLQDRIARALDAAYTAFQASVLAAGHARELSLGVGAIEPVIVKKLVELGIEPATAAIIVRDADLLQTLGPRAAATLAPDALAHLPALLAQPRAVLLDRGTGVLWYVMDAAGPRADRALVIVVDYARTSAAGTQQVNAFRAASLQDVADVRAELASGKLTLLDGSLD